MGPGCNKQGSPLFSPTMGRRSLFLLAHMHSPQWLYLHSFHNLTVSQQFQHTTFCSCISVKITTMPLKDDIFYYSDLLMGQKIDEEGREILLAQVQRHRYQSKQQAIGQLVLTLLGRYCKKGLRCCGQGPGSSQHASCFSFETLHCLFYPSLYHMRLCMLLPLRHG